jgi:hypothetical protein
MTKNAVRAHQDDRPEKSTALPILLFLCAVGLQLIHQIEQLNP